MDEQLPDEVIRDIVARREAGQQVAQIAKQLELPPQLLHAKIQDWCARFGTTPVSQPSVAQEQLQDKAAEHQRLEKVDALLASGDIAGALSEVSPLMLREMIRLALMAENEGVKAKMCTEVTHQAGYKPTQRVDVYSHMDRMTKQELVVQINGFHERHPQLSTAAPLLEPQQQVPPQVQEVPDGE